MNNWSDEEKAWVLTSTELMYDELHNRTQQAKEDLTTLAYEEFRDKPKEHTLDLLKMNEQHEVIVKAKKHGKVVAALQNEIKRLKALDQLKKAEKECDQADDRNATLKQKITQLDVDNAIFEAENARIKKGK
nr:unnamed protein product [Callosobruchus chinensis]